MNPCASGNPSTARSTGDRPACKEKLHAQSRSRSQCASRQRSQDADLCRAGDNKAAIISMLPYKGTGTGMAKKKTAPALCPMPCGERTPLRCACWQSTAPIGRRRPGAKQDGLPGGACRTAKRSMAHLRRNGGLHRRTPPAGGAEGTPFPAGLSVPVRARRRGLRRAV